MKSIADVSKLKLKPDQYESKWPSVAKALEGKQSLKPARYEQKWQEIWEKENVYQPDLNPPAGGAKKPYYNLMMYPYPSAEGLHVGNMYAFTGVDIFGRFMRMRGYDVFEPIGLDGFGIHSENYAIKIGKNPAEQAKISEANFYRQLHAIGNGFAWKNTLETYDPDYYRWTQWIFVKMFENGLAYRKKSPVNFCPSCKTVLSDEQVIDGRCERCKTLVEKREMEQWYFKITDYAEKLLQNTYRPDFNWSEKVKIGQRNWIGKKEGINIIYDIVDTPEKVTVFTTAPVNFGMTFLVLSPEHELTKKIISGKVKVSPQNKAEVEEYVKRAQSKSEQERIAEGREKTGVFTGLYAINQVNGKKVPVWATDFVLGHVGTGAVQGCPGHDLKDFQFAKKFGLPIVRVIMAPDGDKSPIESEEQVIEKGEKGIFVNSEFLNGLSFEEGLQKTMDHFEEKGWGKRVVEYKLRDWCISRQRYWGAPIPMIHCEECGWVAVPEDQLPVLLPENVKDWKPEGTGKGPLAKIKSFVEVACPQCRGAARRETDVCDTFLDSSWYFLRYPSLKINETMNQLTNETMKKKLENWKIGTLEHSLAWDPQITRRWLPVHSYIGGAEHTVLHLLYSRFVTMAFKDFGYLDFEEPYRRFYAHGLIIAEGAKMSKSRGNVVIPDDYIHKYGADTLRTYLMFLGPFDQGGDFRDTGIAGMYRFLSRVNRLVQECQKKVNPQPTTHNPQLDRIMHKTIKEVTEDIENLRYNTAIAHIMEYVNFLTHNPQLTTHNSIKVLLLLLAPFAPHLTEELFQQFFVHKNPKHPKLLTSIHHTSWPDYNPMYLEEDIITIIVQINGKKRDTMKVQSAKCKVQKEVEQMAKESAKVQKYLESQTIRKTIFVPGKLINFVV